MVKMIVSCSPAVQLIELDKHTTCYCFVINKSDRWERKVLPLRKAFSVSTKSDRRISVWFYNDYVLRWVTQILMLERCSILYCRLFENHSK